MSKYFTKKYIEEQIEEKGMEEKQIRIDFTDIAEEAEIREAAAELGYEIKHGEGAGVYWIYAD